MSQKEYIVNLYVYDDGTLAVHSGDIRGLVIETDDWDELRRELYDIVPRLLRSNHGLTEEDLEHASLRLVLSDHRDDGARGKPTTKPHIVWQDDPRITACA